MTTVLSLPKALQLLRDEGGTARRRTWSRDKYITIGLVPWNGEQEALLVYRPKDGRSPQLGSMPTLFMLFGEDVRALDWTHERMATGAKDEPCPVVDRANGTPIRQGR